MNKEDIKKELDNLGVKYNARLGEAKLLALLNESKGVPATVEKSNSEPTTAIVISESGQEFRRYTLEIHGEKFMELAREFVSTRPACTLKLE